MNNRTHYLLLILLLVSCAAVTPPAPITDHGLYAGDPDNVGPLTVRALKVNSYSLGKQLPPRHETRYFSKEGCDPDTESLDTEFIGKIDCLLKEIK